MRKKYNLELLREMENEYNLLQHTYEGTLNRNILLCGICSEDDCDKEYFYTHGDKNSDYIYATSDNGELYAYKWDVNASSLTYLSKTKDSTYGLDVYANSDMFIWGFIRK